VLSTEELDSLCYNNSMVVWTKECINEYFGEDILQVLLKENGFKQSGEVFISVSKPKKNTTHYSKAVLERGVHANEVRD
jgi:hypothetical protein